MKAYKYLITSGNNNNQALCVTKKQATEYKKIFEKTDQELQKVYHWITLPTYKIKKIQRIIDLDTSRMMHIIELNQTLRNQLYNDYMQMLGEQQEEETRLILGEDWTRWIDCKDSYASFYFILKDYKKFLINLDPEYLDEEEKKLYNKLINKIDVLYTLSGDQYYNLDSWLEENSRKLLELIETDLHTYEDVPEESDVINYAEENDQLEDYFIEIYKDGTSNSVIWDLAGRCYM